MVRPRATQWLLIGVATLMLAACQAPGGGTLEQSTEGLPEVDTVLLPEPKARECDCPAPVEPRCLVPKPVPEPAPVCVPPPITDRNHFAGKLVVGSVEFVYIEPGSLKLNARVDTGAETSSLHADRVIRFERDGEAWVRFTTRHDRDAEAVTLELPISRQVRIKSKTEGVDRRVAVEINLRLADVTQRVEVTLVDRGEFEYPVLVGRNYLRDVAIVDVSRRHIHGD